MEKTNIIKVAFDTTMEGIILTDSDAKIVVANKAIEKCLGHKITDLIGKDVNIFLPNFLQEIHSQHYKSYFKKKEGFSHLKNAREVIGLHKDGSFIPLEIRLSMFVFENERYVKALITDITQRKEKEEINQIAKMKLEAKVKDNTRQLKQVVKELRLTNKALEIEIQQKIKAKEKAKEALIAERELSQLKTKFISLASHEFRTPLSGILTSATLIEKYNLEKNKPVEKHLRIIKSMVKHLNNILNDFLSLERVESGETQYKFSSFPFNKLMDEIIEEAKSFTKKGQLINYTPRIDCPNMYQDRKIVYIILSNILYNAIKYSQENTSIDINIIIDKNITISISDSGIGIPNEDQKYIFKRFYRASNTTHIQGTGLGLNIVKANIEALGGSISFNSEENQGTKFILIIPKRFKANC